MIIFYTSSGTSSRLLNENTHKLKQVSTILLYVNIKSLILNRKFLINRKDKMYILSICLLLSVDPNPF